MIFMNSWKSVEFCSFRAILLAILLACRSHKNGGKSHFTDRDTWGIEHEPTPIADILAALQDPEFQLHLQSLQAEQRERELLGEEPEKVRAWYRAELRELMSWYETEVVRWTTTE